MTTNRPRKQVGKWNAFFDGLRRFFFPPKPDFSDLDYGKKASERETVARFSRGNIRLQQGRYVTREQIDEGLLQCREYAEKYGDWFFSVVLSVL